MRTKFGINTEKDGKQRFHVARDEFSASYRPNKGILDAPSPKVRITAWGLRHRGAWDRTDVYEPREHSWLEAVGKKGAADRLTDLMIHFTKKYVEATGEEVTF